MIGVFDSGIGGLTVVKELRKQLPQYSVIYFGDTGRTPYGNKSDATVIGYAKQNTAFLLEQGAKIIVIACNTVSSVAADALKEEYPDVPIFEVVTPAVNAAVTKTHNNKIGVIGTRTTINSTVYKNKIATLQKDVDVFSKACPLLVPLVEEGMIEQPITKMIVKKCLAPLQQKNIDTLILGCTHYPFLQKVIQQKIGKKVTLIDPATPTVTQIKDYLDAHPVIAQTLDTSGKCQFYFSDIPPHLSTMAEKWLGHKIKPQLHHI